MNKKLILLIFISMFAISFASAAYEVNYTSSTTNGVEISQLKYDPYPASPGEYIDVWVKATTGTAASNLTFKLMPEYPFSLDANENAIRSFGNISTEVVMDYKVRIDKNAVEGINPLKLQYSLDGNDYNAITKSFDIDIENSLTSFDAVIQDVSGSSVSIAIANVGKYAANSVVVRIPEQDDFAVSGTDGQMVGNLASGDYTVVGFTIDRKEMFSQNRTRGTTDIPAYNVSSNELKFDIYYTDNIGERRVVNMNASLRMAGNATASGFAGRGSKTTTTSTSIFSSWYTWLVIIVVICLGLWYRKNPDKFKNLFSRKKSMKDGEVPSWVRSAREKKK